MFIAKKLIILSRNYLLRIYFDATLQIRKNVLNRAITGSSHNKIGALLPE